MVFQFKGKMEGGKAEHKGTLDYIVSFKQWPFM